MAMFQILAVTHTFDTQLQYYSFLYPQKKTQTKPSPMRTFYVLLKEMVANHQTDIFEEPEIKIHH